MGTATSTRPVIRPPYDVERIRLDFPILKRLIHGKPLVHLDNAATTQKPRRVLDRLQEYYEAENANIHRGVHYLSEIATKAYEDVREKVRVFLGAPSTRGIVFTRGTTDGINLVAQTFGRTRVGPGRDVLLTAMEHHSNIVPWQILCGERGAKLRVVPMNDRGEIDLEEYEKLLSANVALVAVAHVSNALGTVNPVAEMTQMAHAQGIPILIDGAQAAGHLPVDVSALDCDFYVLSGHKMYAPTGTGALYGKESLLEAMPPYQGGGDMIKSVTFEKTTYNDLPYKFEAGTPNIGDTIAFGAALDYLRDVGFDTLQVHEDDLLQYATESLSGVEGLTLIGTARNKTAVVSFVIDGVHPHDIGTIVDMEGVAIRTGHHCAQPVMERFGVPATARASFACYNTRHEIDTLVNALGRVVSMVR